MAKSISKADTSKKGYNEKNPTQPHGTFTPDSKKKTEMPDNSGPVEGYTKNEKEAVGRRFG